MQNPGNRLDHIFTGIDTPERELLFTLLLSLEDHYPGSDIRVEQSLPNSRIVAIEGRHFAITITELK